MHAAWASLAAYDGSAAGEFLNKAAAKAKGDLRAAGFELVREYSVYNGKDYSLDGGAEVDEYDVASMWLREADGRTIVAFRGSDTQKNLRNVRNPATCSMYGHQLHEAVAEGEFAPLVAQMSAADFSGSSKLVATGHSLGGGCASLLAVLMNDKSDPLGFGAQRKTVDELYGFGATPVFHESELETPNEYGCHVRGGPTPFGVSLDACPPRMSTTRCAAPSRAASTARCARSTAPRCRTRPSGLPRRASTILRPAW